MSRLCLCLVFCTSIICGSWIATTLIITKHELESLNLIIKVKELKEFRSL